MMQWINQQTFDGLAFTNKDGNLKEAIRQESELLKALREFVPEAELCYRISYEENGCENYCHLELIMQGRSWFKPFTSKQELAAWCRDNQPYYKKRIPGVVSYFARKYHLN